MGLFDIFANKKVKQERKAQEAELHKLAQEIGLYKDDKYERKDQVDLNPEEFSLDIFEKMLLDGQVRAAVEMIKLSATAKGFTVTGEDEETRKYAEFILENFESIEGNLEDDIREIITAIVYGYSCTEKVFEYKDGAIRLKKLKTLHPRQVAIKTDRFGNILYVEQRIGSKTIKIPREKVLWYAYDKDFGNLYGKSNLRPIYKHWITKDRLYRFANIAYERYGTPLLVGTTTDANDVGKMNKILKNINSMSSLSISGGDKVDAIQMTNADFIGYIEHHDRKIMEGLLVPPMLLGLSRGQSGSYALSGNQFDIFMIRLESIQRNIKALIEEEIIRPLIDLNFPNAKKYPSFQFKPMADKDITKLASVMNMMITSGVVAPSEDWIREELGMPPASEEAKEELYKRNHPEEQNPETLPEDDEKKDEQKAYTCPYDGESFKNKQSLNHHMRSKHGAGQTNNTKQDKAARGLSNSQAAKK
ncbi:phage portal protein family protein [Bacillus cereus]|uniref:phage portal protein family protein n=1 Tax=Bacillus cereus TaxID=1396 RepID=UPI000BF7F560|nr:DUF935 family protein [Bacillus cereus]PFK68261.1 hypothetical protein COJ25_17140 [Bacillus cereus]